MKKIRFGIVGVGNQGTYYITSIFNKNLAENALLTAVCDINENKIKKIIQKDLNIGKEFDIIRL